MTRLSGRVATRMVSITWANKHLRAHAPPVGPSDRSRRSPPALRVASWRHSQAAPIFRLTALICLISSRRLFYSPPPRDSPAGFQQKVMRLKAGDRNGCKPKKTIRRDCKSGGEFRAREPLERGFFFFFFFFLRDCARSACARCQSRAAKRASHLFPLCEMASPLSRDKAHKEVRADYLRWLAGQLLEMKSGA